MLPMMDEREFRSLVERGDAGQAAGEVLRRVGPKILAYQRAVLRDEDAAADAFSIFAETLWKSLPSFRWESSLRTWTFRIAAEEPGLRALVTDVVLPERNGWDLSRDLAKSRPGLAVLFMSGYAAHPSGEQLLPDGAPLLAKPFTPDDLLRSVRAILDGAHPPSSAPKRSA